MRRERECLKKGAFEERILNKNCFVYERFYQKERLFIVCNFENSTELSGLPKSGKLLLSNLGKTNEKLNRLYLPYETAIYEIE